MKSQQNSRQPQRKKDYKRWHTLKTSVNNTPLRRFQEREIWWCSLGENVGFEEDGKNSLFERPVLVLRKFNKELFIGVPLTGKYKKSPYYLRIIVGGTPRAAMVSQVRALSSRRLIRKIERHGKASFEKVQRGVVVAIQKTIPPQSGGSPVPSGNLYYHNSKQKRRSQDFKGE